MDLFTLFAVIYIQKFMYYTLSSFSHVRLSKHEEQLAVRC